eukprot:TRINITY_DN6409_c0_g2_i5.p1 TRINITY_DN6409_c0_g2~~TRINITY_DN6409_c0_g2_i5.p1  ORF type:complete len:311 (+),score=91.39 TRINITY_DN6409_c0_g2_i5:66-998(+)
MCIRDSQKLCPAVIAQREEFSDVDFILTQSQGFALRRQTDAMTRQFYVSIEGEEIRCVIDNLSLHPVESWIIQVKFRRFIPGRPNRLVLPITLKKEFKNSYFNKEGTLKFRLDEIEIVTYNEDYPTTIDIDIENLTPLDPIRVGDIMRSLPDGVLLSPKYKNLHEIVATISMPRDDYIKDIEEHQEEWRKKKEMGEDAYDEYLEQLEDQKIKAQEEESKKSHKIEIADLEKDIKEYEAQAGEDTEVLSMIEDLKRFTEQQKRIEASKQAKKEAQAKRPRKEKSLKKIIAGMSAQLKAELGQEDEGKGKKK